jgi:ribonuclease HII
VPDLAREADLWRQGFRHVAGVDEAGRGPLAGPVVAAAVILPRDWPPAAELDDSKRLTPERREVLFETIRAGALAWRARVMAPAVIDRVNILQATLQGMALAVSALRPAADYVLVDGNRLPALEPPAEAIVRGDGRCCSIAAASIVAKVVRDRLMRVYGRRFPQWGFAQHKGYPTRAHLEALRRWGPSPIHRRSFRLGEGSWPTGPRSGAVENPSLPGIWSSEAMPSGCGTSAARTARLT